MDFYRRSAREPLQQIILASLFTDCRMVDLRGDVATADDETYLRQGIGGFWLRLSAQGGEI
jgi:hypothetical protein